MTIEDADRINLIKYRLEQAGETIFILQIQRICMFIEYFRKQTCDPDGVEPTPTCIFYKHLMPPASFDIHEMSGLSKGKKESLTQLAALSSKNKKNQLKNRFF